jgi:Uma2 family endonuclease
MSVVASHRDFHEPVFRLSVRQYHAMIAAGVLSDDDPVELLEGVLVFKIPKNPPHRIALARLRRAVEKRLSPLFSLQLQEPITTPDSEPEPDAAVIRGEPEDYPDRHPGPSDVLLVVEVADTTLDRDRGIKLRGYARAGIEEYWIVNIPDAQLEVYTDPDSQAATPAYRKRQILKRGQVVQLKIGGQGLDIAVTELLP